ncbi:hypothetical protein AgCh_009129 [Apium graveolens]
MRTVRNTVDTGRTVVCTIHQPSIDIFQAFDELFLMKRGGLELYAELVGRHSCELIKYSSKISKDYKKQKKSDSSEACNHKCGPCHSSKVAHRIKAQILLSDSSASKDKMSIQRRISVSSEPGSLRSLLFLKYGKEMLVARLESQER